MKNSKRVIALVLAVIMAIMMLGISPNVFAEGVETITLDADRTDPVIVAEGKTVVLDLNGHNLTTTGAGFDAIRNHGTLTIKGSGDVTSQGAAIVNYPGGTVTVNSGNYLSTGWYTIKNMGTMTINNLTFKNNVNNGASLIDNGFYGNAANDRGITDYSKPVSLVINGGTFENRNNSCNVIKNDDFGVLTINGGTFVAKSDATDNANPVIQNWHKTTIKGGTFTSTNGVAVANGNCSDTSDVGELTIEGGTFTANSSVSLFGVNIGATQNKGIAHIKGGTFNGYMLPTKVYTDENSKTYYTFDITGGTFTSANVVDIVALGYTAYSVDGKYVVDRTPSTTMVDFIPPMKVDETATLKITTNPTDLAKYVSYAIKSGSDVIKLEGSTVTALKAGSATITYTLGKLSSDIIVRVYEVAPEDAKDEAEEAVTEMLAAVMDDLENKGAEFGLTDEEIGLIDEAKYNGDTITIEIAAGEVTEPTEEEAELVEDKVEAGQKIAGYYDISVLIKANGEEIAKLRNLGEKIKVLLELDENLPKVADGFVRKFFVVRIHDGKAEIIAENLTAEDGKLPVESDKFSTYAVGYEDVVKTADASTSETTETAKTTSNPKTADTIMITMSILAIAALGMVVTIKSRKK